MLPDKLKSLKVADLRSILSKASVPAPARATKADLVSRILASDNALQVFHSLYPDPAHNQESPTATESSAPTPAATPQAPVPTTAPSSNPAAESSTDSDAVKRERRAERFGIPAASPSSTQQVDPELEKRQKRAERFGIPLVGQKQSDDADKLKARTARFGSAGQKRAAPGDVADADELERRKKRAERFGLVM